MSRKTEIHESEWLAALEADRKPPKGGKRLIEIARIWGKSESRTQKRLVKMEGQGEARRERVSCNVYWFLTDPGLLQG